MEKDLVDLFARLQLVGQKGGEDVAYRGGKRLAVTVAGMALQSIVNTVIQPLRADRVAAVDENSVDDFDDDRLPFLMASMEELNRSEVDDLSTWFRLRYNLTAPVSVETNQRARDVARPLMLRDTSMPPQQPLRSLWRPAAPPISPLNTSIVPFVAPKKDSLQRNRSTGTIAASIVLSRISA